MACSKESLQGLAAAHLVCADLILQGYPAFLSAEGLHYDVVVDINGILKRVQVKSTAKLHSDKKSKNIYRFGTRKGKGGRDRYASTDFDFYAFVVIATKQVAYLTKEDMLMSNGQVKQTVDFKTRAVEYIGRVYSNGTVRKPEWGKYFEDYEKFNAGGTGSAV